MDILLANPFFYPYYGGTEKVLFEVGKRLASGHSITVLTARLDNTQEREEMDGMRVIRLPSMVLHSAPHPIPPPVPVLFNPGSWLKSNINDFDIVHVNNRFIFPPSFGSIAVRNNRKLCLTLHNARPERIDPITDAFGSLFDDFFAKGLMRQCHGIAGVSDATISATVPRDFRGIKTTIHNGVDHSTFAPRKSRKWKDRLGIGGKMVLTNVRLVQQKGVAYLIDAMRGIDADLVVFGRGPLRPRLERQAKAAGVRAHFVSERLDDMQLSGLYNAADCFAMPSLYDPCPLALVEGMSCGLPCVVTDAGGMKEQVQDKKSGIVVPAANPAALATAISRVLGDRRLGGSLGREARKRVLGLFTWERVAREYEAFYRTLLE